MKTASANPPARQKPPCPRCGAAFPAAAGCAPRCASCRGCALVTCAACGEPFPDPQRSRLAYALSRWLNRCRTGAAARDLHSEHGAP